MPSKSNILFLLSGLILLFFSGCGRKPAPVAYPELDITDKEPMEILLHVSENAQNIASLRGIATLKLSIDGQEDSFDAVTLFQKPDSLRLDAYGFWGKLFMIGVLEGEMLEVYLPTEDVVVESRVNSPKLKEWIGMDFDFSDLILVFNRFSSLLQVDPSMPLILESEAGNYKLTIQREHRRTTFHVQPNTFLIRKVENWNNIRLEQTIYSFEDYEKINGISFPQKIKISRPLESQSVLLHYEDMELNIDLNPVEFQFNVPKNVDYYFLDD
jgi:outer membrane lipoprotein-sorting protein